MRPNSNISVLQFALKWEVHLLLIVGFAVVVSAIFSGEYFIQPKFKSTAVIYPANLVPFGNETPTEQLLQMFESADIRSQMCDKFNLTSRYKIDPNQKGARAILFAIYNEHVDVRRTEFESVQIDVYDHDPQVACNMVDTLIHLMNLKVRSLQRSKTAEIVKILKDQLSFKRIQIDSLEKALRDLREKYGLLDYYIQSKEALRRYYKLISTGASKEKLKELDGIIRNLEEKGGESVSLKEMHQKMFEVYTDIRVQYEKALSDNNKELTYANIVAKPYPADKKSSPVRWIIVSISGISALIFAILLILLFENKEIITKPKSID